MDKHAKDRKKNQTGQIISVGSDTSKKYKICILLMYFLNVTKANHTNSAAKISKQIFDQ